MSQKLFVTIGCDTDPDRREFVESLPTDGLSWRGMLEGIPLLKSRISGYLDSEGRQPILSWCLRVDEQVKHYYGNYASILELHRDFFLELEQTGDELAWHPHFWRRDDGSNKWFQECFDVEWQVEMLRGAYRDYQRVLPGRAKSVRMGWDYHNTETFRTLQELGVVVDFSGIPGMRIDPGADPLSTFNSFDWDSAPNAPYFPSQHDYKRTPKPGEDRIELLEAPNFVSESLMWGMVRGLVMARKMKSPSQVFRALRRPTYWINITGKPSLFAPILRQLKKRLSRGRSTQFVSYFHPDELLPPINDSSLYSLEYMAENIFSIMEAARELSVEVEYVRAKDILTRFPIGAEEEQR